MTSLSERERIIEIIKEAHQSGARLFRACETVGISLDTWSRWQDKKGRVLSDRRPEALHPTPYRKLGVEEQEEILKVCNSEKFSSLPPSQIVPRLADEENRYIGSCSTFYRLLRKANQLAHRGRTSPPKKISPPTSYVATGPNQVWTWDITWLPCIVEGKFYKLYMIMDIFSRFPVASEIYEEECGDLAAELVQRAVISQKCATLPLVLHSDNGSPMKSYTLQAKLRAMGIEISYSRPRVSNDNPFSEALFGVMKRCPCWPDKKFSSLEEARQWLKIFIQWYGYEHRHGGIKFVTPAQKHNGQDIAILQNRRKIWEAAFHSHPERWSNNIQNWDPITEVHLNPEKKLQSIIISKKIKQRKKNSIIL